MMKRSPLEHAMADKTKGRLTIRDLENLQTQYPERFRGYQPRLPTVG
jgi:hypothetical protein